MILQIQIKEHTMRVFVTGGAGYVGSHCVKRLIAGGHDVTVFDNLSAGHRKAVDPRAGFVQGDLSDKPRLADLLAPSRFDAVMHFAGYLNVGESVEQPLAYYRNNVVNTLNMLECMERSAVRRMVFSSTCAVYGEPEALPITEDMPKRPISPYGASKLTVEYMLEHSARAWGLGSIALRYFNASGAASDGSIGEDHSPEIHLIPLVLQVALGQREKIKVFGDDYSTPDGSCIRDYIHVDDLAEAHLLALEGAAEGRMEAFNVGTGTGTSVFELIEVARKVTGHAIPAEVTGRRPGDPPRLYANSDKLRERFRWSPRYLQIRDIVDSAWQWHRAHPRGFES
jgi:UDP-glucose 4-epimerase